MDFIKDIMTLSYKEMLEDLGQECIDWYEDTGDCHICQTCNGKHDPDFDNGNECPVKLAIEKRDNE